MISESAAAHDDSEDLPNKIISSAIDHLEALPGHVFEILALGKPASCGEAQSMVRILSKLSPLVGNLIEFRIVDFLNEHNEFAAYGKWIRQDPDFPDALFKGTVLPPPGFEIKAWFPLATEITARFRESQFRFAAAPIQVVLLAWLPEHVVYGRPQVIDLCVVSGFSVAEARDTHYHKPPDYIVLEPEDTSARTSNLQQTNTNGYKWQDEDAKLREAKAFVKSWPGEPFSYDPNASYQQKLRQLLAKYRYRLDTNFAKMDRIEHEGIEAFKTKVLESQFKGKRIAEWANLLYRSETGVLDGVLTRDLGIDLN